MSYYCIDGQIGLIYEVINAILQCASMPCNEVLSNIQSQIKSQIK